MLYNLVTSVASLAGIILTIFWTANWMSERIVFKTVDAPPEQRSRFSISVSPRVAVVLNIIAVAAYFTVMLSCMVFVFHHFPGTTNLLLVTLFTIITYRFFLFLSEIMGNDVTRFPGRILPCLLGFSITALWTLYPNWVTIDLGATLCAIAMLIMLGTIPLRALVIVAIGVTIYDVVAVFGTGQMIEMAGAAKALPMLFIVPKSFEWWSAPAQMLGVGDVVIPGAIVMAALKTKIRHVHIYTIIGYFIGLSMAIAVVHLVQFPQPATIYLVPGVLLGLTIAAYRANVLRETFAAEK